ncbi:MAG TPA: shikimate kinase [Candidatus Acidoferrales bacterium]
MTGFMGSGKSTVARLLARQIGWIHVDLDRRITDATGLSIPEIFAQQGEPAFREIEHQQLEKSLGEATSLGRSTVISLGGGTTAQPANLALLERHAVTLVWLDCPIEELLRRCAHITNRPLFRDEASFRELHRQRLPFYELAHFRVEVSTEPLRVVEQILSLGVLDTVPA